MVAERFARVLQAAVASVLGPQATVDVRRRPAARGPPPAPREPLPTQAVPEHHGINPNLTFEQFVIGDANRFAHAAALAVAELPGHAYNPLFVYGPPGVGKTHLLHSSGTTSSPTAAGLTVRYTTVETFTNQFLAALHGKDMDRFKGRYRHADVLLIDDIQFLASKAKTEEEFFHTFNALHDLGSQLVLTSDRSRVTSTRLEDRLRERFEAGLVAAIEPPDLTTRVAVLRKRAQHDGVALADDGVLPLLADRAPDSVRALEGALIRVVAYASLTGRPLTSALAAKVLDDLYPAPPQAGAAPRAHRRSDPGDHRRRVRPHARRAPLRSRAARLAWPRQVAMYLAREHTGETCPPSARASPAHPHHRAARLPTHRASASPRPRGLRLRSAPHRAPAPGGSGPERRVLDMTDRLAGPST